MRYRVELADSAFVDLRRLLAALADRSPEAAERLADRFNAALDRLESNPYSCGLAFESRQFSLEVRHLLFGFKSARKYRALFVIEGELVKVLCIRAPGESPVDREALMPSD